jgi:hypothetical protein
MKTKDEIISMIDSIKFPNYTQEAFDDLISSMQIVYKGMLNNEIEITDLNSAMCIMPILMLIGSDVKQNLSEEQLREEWSWVVDENKFNERMSKLKEYILKSFDYETEN